MSDVNVWRDTVPWGLLVDVSSDGSEFKLKSPNIKRFPYFIELGFFEYLLYKSKFVGIWGI